ncbi:hypothetical protein [Paraglaciecola sp.]|uniref:hypothetical protein n=1 Tax=Paraglaciecola sp. TaxID=1920173 RepID=UPI003EF2BF09
MDFKYAVISVSLLFVVNISINAGTIDFLEVDNDVVLFSTTDAKTHTLPSCVTAENANLWSVSLANESGRATYSLILTAMARGDSVALDVESADDCVNRPGAEDVSKVNLVVNSPSSATNNVNSFYKLAPHLTYPEDKWLTGSTRLAKRNVNAFGSVTNILSLTGRHKISYLEIENLNGGVEIKLTVDGIIIWNGQLSESGTRHNLFGGNNQPPEFFIVEDSLLLDVQTNTDPDFNLYYLARPIQ